LEKTVLIIATLDTKGEEVKYIKEKLEGKGKRVLVLDSGTRGAPIGVKADIPREEVAKAAGSDIEKVNGMRRGPAIEVMKKGIAKICKELYEAGRVHGIMSLGGSDGACLASAGMQVLPPGVPKMLISPVFQGKETFGEFVGSKDILCMHSMIDILGINQFSRKIFDNAVGAMVGMLDADVSPKVEEGKMIGTTMYGNTTPAVMRAKSLLERDGFEVLVFHPNGTGGRIMEQLAEEGILAGVLDITPHEFVDEMYGGQHAGGPRRLEVVGEVGVPQVVAPGCVDFILWGGPLPERYKDRRTYPFNPYLTLVRTTVEEMVEIGETMAKKLNKAIGPVTVVVPLKGMSMYNKPGDPIYYPEADAAFLKSLKAHLDPKIKLVEVDAHINDPVFADRCVSELEAILGKG
jgi:uncharacterized protein (UPF0261 family)